MIPPVEVIVTMCPDLCLRITGSTVRVTFMGPLEVEGGDDRAPGSAPQSPGPGRPPASQRSHRMTSDTAGSVSSTSAAVPWARIGDHVGQRNLAVTANTANTYSHVLADFTRRRSLSSEDDSAGWGLPEGKPHQRKCWPL